MATQSTNFKETLRQNKRDSRMVMALFVLIYAALGFLFDLYLAANHFPDVPLSELAGAILTLQIFPIATLIAAAIAAICIYITYASYDQLMLMGTDYFEITPTSARNTLEQQIYNVIEEVKIAASLQYMPRVYIIEADYMNAFASGFSEKSAMIAITRALAEKLNRSELQAVLAHELSHIRHLDIKVTLFATVLSNLILMLVDVLFWSLMFSGRTREEGRDRNQLFFIVMILRYLLPLITIVLQLYLSRRRELMADSGAVELMRDNVPLAHALLKIDADHKENKDAYEAQYAATQHEQVRASAYLYDPQEAGINFMSSLNDLFSTHPTIAQRLKAIGFKEE